MNIQRIGNQANVETGRPGNFNKQKPALTDTTDRVSRGETGGFLGKIKNFVRTNITGKTAQSEESVSKEKTRDFGIVSSAALAGGIVGGTAGAVAGYVTTETDPSKLPENSVDLEWAEPVMQKRYLGEIPRDRYEPINHPYKSVGKELATAFKLAGQDIRDGVDPTRPVYADAPAVAPGEEGVMMVQKQQTFTGRGEVEVDWQTKGINEPYLAGYNDNPVEDVSSRVIGHTPDGTPVEQEFVDGINHKYTPDIRYQEVGEYRIPQVKFKTPDPWERAGMGLAIGAMLGTTVGVVIGVIQKVLGKD